MQLLNEFGEGDAKRWGAMAQQLAERAEKERDWDRAEGYWLRKVEWDEAGDDQDARRVSVSRYAEVLVNVAERFLARPEPDHLSASIQLQRAFEALRRIGETQRANELHQELLRQQGLAAIQMESFSQSMDVGESVRKSMDAVRDKSLIDALLILAQMAKSPKTDELRERADRLAEETALFDLLASSERVDKRGRVIARRPSRRSSNPAEAVAAVEADMFDYASHLQQVYSVALIEPARYQINLEHHVRDTDFIPLLRNNPFVPPDRETVFAMGLHAGLVGDFIGAGHFLVLQIENSIRYLLNERGVITTGMSQQGVQEEQDLGYLLRREEVMNILGGDVVFDLRGLLVERFGSNLRNRVAHGLMDQQDFFAFGFRYFWWLVLRICCLPVLIRLDRLRERSLGQADGVDQPDTDLTDEPPSGDGNDREQSCL